MIKKILFIIILCCIRLLTTAQVLGLGGSFNHNSNGINLFYAHISKNQNWEYDAGIRVAINTFSINKNKQHATFYQTGYAYNFPQHFSLNFRVNKKIITYKPLSLYAMSNLHIACLSLLQRQNTYDSTGKPDGKYYVNYFKPSPSIELTLGLLLQAKLSNKLSAFMTAGVGYIYSHHTYVGWNKTDDNILYIYRSRYRTPFKNRGHSEFVGLDGLPFMSAGIKYSIK